MERIGTAAVIPLLKEAELEAERTAGWVRIVLATVLVASLLVSGRLAAAAGNEEIWARLGLGALAIGALLALGILSLVLVRTGAAERSWTC
jgi:adenylate cyclase